MAKASERILEALSSAPLGLCDDCLSEESGVRPRQQVHQRATELQREGRIFRERQACSACGKTKLVSSPATGRPPSASKLEVAPEAKQGRPWYWEGNVQARIATHLASQGCEIRSVASTEARAQGKDIEATMSDGRTLWVSVKGWPEKNEHTQARHWFAGALFDIILYRSESPNAVLAIGLPTGFATYSNLWNRVKWFRETTGLRTYWVKSDGTVEGA